jgi:hypothetical protein
MSDQQKRKILIIVCVVLLGIIFLLVIISSTKRKTVSLPVNNNGKPVPTLMVRTPTNPTGAALPQLLQLTFAYDANTQAITLVRKVQSNGTVSASDDTLFPYQLLELDDTNTVIFSTRFGVQEAFSVDGPTTRTGMQVVSTSQNTVSVPYPSNAKTIIVLKNNVRQLMFPIK